MDENLGSTKGEISPELFYALIHSEAGGANGFVIRLLVNPEQTQLLLFAKSINTRASSARGIGRI
jgi:hypothetical protein